MLQDDVKESLLKTFEQVCLSDLLDKLVEFDDDTKKIINDNLWDLYD